MSRKPRPSLAWYAPRLGRLLADRRDGRHRGRHHGRDRRDLGGGGRREQRGRTTIARMPVRRIERTLPFSRRGRAGSVRAMGRLIYSAIASLDGYVADEHGKWDWSIPDRGGPRLRQRPLARQSAPGCSGAACTTCSSRGRRWTTRQPEMRDFAEIWRGADKIVYSRTLEEASQRAHADRARVRPRRGAAAEGRARTATSASPGRSSRRRRSAAGLVDESTCSCRRSWSAAATPALPSRRDRPARAARRAPLRQRRRPPELRQSWVVIASAVISSMPAVAMASGQPALGGAIEQARCAADLELGLTQRPRRRRQRRAGVHEVVDQVDGAARPQPLTRQPRVVRQPGRRRRTAGSSFGTSRTNTRRQAAARRPRPRRAARRRCRPRRARRRVPTVRRRARRPAARSSSGPSEQPLEVGDADAAVAVAVGDLDVRVALAQDPRDARRCRGGRATSAQPATNSGKLGVGGSARGRRRCRRSPPRRARTPRRRAPGCPRTGGRA